MSFAIYTCSSAAVVSLLLNLEGATLNIDFTSLPCSFLTHYKLVSEVGLEQNADKKNGTKTDGQ